MKMKIFGLTFQDSLKANHKANITKMGPKKEVHLDKVHILQEIELIYTFNSLYNNFII